MLKVKDDFSMRFLEREEQHACWLLSVFFSTAMLWAVEQILSADEGCSERLFLVCFVSA
jgi:hypothetical protein